ncbi:exonuclease domain-containing protein [Kitasatospora sp. NPDC056731]|uniref:exonuclease domain-containing protein n=1 Tax=Kitasatospora sp. NPDC056731 TaxID=3155422 RepID=UPI003443F53E
MDFTAVRKAGFDTETTGPDPETARIVTAAVVAHGGGHADRVLTWLINPGVPIPPEATAIHGVDDATAQAKGRQSKKALEKIAGTLASALRFGMPVVAFNLAFDWTVLDRELLRHGLATMDQRVSGVPALVDPHVIDKQVIPRRRGSGMRKLQPTATVYGVVLEDWHTAEADAVAALRIAEAQFARFPQLNSLVPAELFRAQQAWRAEQQAGLQEWFRTRATPEQGGAPDKVIDGAWPLLSTTAGVAS